MTDESELFAPSGCDEHGNTYYPYVIKGVISKYGHSIRVLEPVEFAARRSTISTLQVSRTDDAEPRRLTHAQVMEFAKRRVPCVHDEDRAASAGLGPRA